MEDIMSQEQINLTEHLYFSNNIALSKVNGQEV